MFLEKPDEKDLKKISLNEFEEGLMKYVQPERLSEKTAKIYVGVLPDKLNWCDPTTAEAIV